MAYHKPVLLRESIDGLALRQGGVYVDLTFGGGGHSAEILKKLKGGRLVAFDQDQDSMTEAEKINDKRFLFISGNFRFFRNYLRYYEIYEVDGILADLGVSSHHFDEPERGFSFSMEGPLDMRMNKSSSTTAADVVNGYKPEQLAEVFFRYGELKNSRKLSRAIAETREKQPIKEIQGLVRIVDSCIPERISPRQRNKYYAKVFQALRIEINKEVDSLREMLGETLSTLKKGGRLVVISYHSLEDRLVKNFMRAGNVEGKLERDFYGEPKSPFRPVNRKVIVPDESQIKENNRARSARLRIAERVF